MMTDLQAVELNVNSCIFKINKMYRVLGLGLVSFDEGHLIQAFGSVTGIIAALDTLEKLRENDIDVYLFNRVDKAIISVFASELSQALNTIIFLYEKKYDGLTID